jgi:hypothetical protein
VGDGVCVPKASESGLNKKLSIVRQSRPLPLDEIIAAGLPDDGITATIGFRKNSCGKDCNEFRLVGDVFALSFFESARMLAFFQGKYELPDGTAAGSADPLGEIDGIPVGLGRWLEPMPGLGLYFDLKTINATVVAVMIDAEIPSREILVPVDRIRCSGCGFGESLLNAKVVNLKAQAARYRLGGTSESTIGEGDRLGLRGYISVETKDTSSLVMTGKNVVVTLNDDVMNQTFADASPADRKIGALLLFAGFLFGGPITRWIKLHIRS